MPLSESLASSVARGEKRSRSTSPANKEEDPQESSLEAEESVPFLTTLSMNHRSLFYGRKDISRGLAMRSARSDASTLLCAMEKNGDVQQRVGLNAAPNASSVTDNVLSSVQATEESAALADSIAADDTTYLHSMLKEIVDAAAVLPPASSTGTSTTHRDTLPACAYLLRSYFRFSSGAFKPHQQEVCFSILSGRNTLAVCPTGWGKSLCYQFPMLVHRLLFECRYEQWCRQTGVSSALTKAEQAQEVDGSSSEKHQHAASSCLPADLYSRFCIVVSPLVALMEDQAEKINSVAHLNAFVLSSKVDADREAQLYRELESPLCPLDIIFVSPEKFISHVGLRRMLQSQAHRLAMVCVDEVHCVSGWAYDFRPTFMYVSRVLESPLLHDSNADEAVQHTKKRVATSSTGANEAFCSARTAAVPYLCLTATATAAVIRDVQHSFSIERTILCTDQQRDNLTLQAVNLVARHTAFHHLSSKPDGGTVTTHAEEEEAHEPSPRVVQDALLEAVRDLPKPMLVYVQSRADADELSGLLSTKLALGGPRSSSSPGAATHGATHGVGGGGVFHAAHYADKDAVESESAAPASTTSSTSKLVIRCYHAALTRAMRTATQRQFLDDKVDVLVATVAFGMGIDKANIRSVVHASAPSSLEGYVQEIGRAGRDGERSVCRILYNPYDFYALRSRLWTSLLSLSEMQTIVRAILSGPVTRFGQRLMLVSVSALSTELGFSPETIETVLFLLLTEIGSPGASSNFSGVDPPGLTAKLHAPFRAVLGSYPLKYKVLSVNGEAEREGDTSAMGGASSASSTSGRASAQRRRTASTAAAAATAGVGMLLRQLGATDAVLELCRVMPNMSSQIDLANRLSMSLAEVQQRMQDLIRGQTITVARYGVPSAFLLEVTDSFAEAASPAGQEALASHLVALHRGRLDAQVRGLRTMFRLLASPTHASIASALRSETLGACVDSLPAATQPWAPPGRSCGRMQAVSIANAFVEENRLRIHSTYEALRALMGIRPKSLIQFGKYAGQLPLSQSWYVNSPYFGALRTFDLAWVLQILVPHQLDVPQNET